MASQLPANVAELAPTPVFTALAPLIAQPAAEAFAVGPAPEDQVSPPAAGPVESLVAPGTGMLEAPTMIPGILAFASTVPTLPLGDQAIVDLVPNVSDLLTETVAALPLGGVLDVPAAAIGAVGETLGQLVGTVSGTVGTLPDPVGEVVDDLPVTDLLGADPVGGIATLVNLVTVADVLDLQDAGAPANSGGLLSPVENLLDTLTAEPTAPPETIDDDQGQDGTSPIDDPLPDLPILGALHSPSIPDLGLGHGG